MALSDTAPAIIGGAIAAAAGAYGVWGAVKKTEITTEGRNSNARNILKRWRDYYQQSSPKPPPPPSLLDDTDRELDRSQENE